MPLCAGLSVPKRRGARLNFRSSPRFEGFFFLSMHFLPHGAFSFIGGGQDGVDVEAAVVVPADDLLLLRQRDALSSSRNGSGSCRC